MARARPTRLRMPPDNSAGYFCSTSCRSTTASFSFTFSRISCSESPGLCSRRGKATLSPTVIESNNAELWNTMPIRSRKTASCCRLIVDTFSPSTITWPWSGLKSPMMCFINTVLPLPEAPSTTVVVPSIIFRLIPFRTGNPAKLLYKS